MRGGLLTRFYERKAESHPSPHEQGSQRRRKPMNSIVSLMRPKNVSAYKMDKKKGKGKAEDVLDIEGASVFHRVLYP